MLGLVTTFYNEMNRSRMAELETCLALNRLAFDWICVLAEGVTESPIKGINEWWFVSSRPMYCDALKAASASSPDDVVVIANCDIRVPRESLQLIDANIQPGQAYCLTRWENGSVWNVEYSQDAWVFRGRPMLRGGMGRYRFGVPGCDNRFAAELRAAGYAVLNPSRSIRTWHYHESAVRTATNCGEHRVDLPYLYVWPHELGEEPLYRQPERQPLGDSAYFTPRKGLNLRNRPGRP
jgi:hypothetical protein